MANLRFDFKKEGATLDRALTLYAYLLSMPKENRPFPLNCDPVTDDPDEPVRAHSLRTRAYEATMRDMKREWGI